MHLQMSAIWQSFCLGLDQFCETRTSPPFLTSVFSRPHQRTQSTSAVMSVRLSWMYLASEKTRFFNPLLGKPVSNRHLSLPLPHVACQTLNPGAAKSAHSIRLSYLQSDLITAMMAQWQHGTAFSPDKSQLTYTFSHFFCYQLIFCSRCVVLISKRTIVSWRFGFHEHQLDAMHPIMLWRGAPSRNNGAIIAQ